jgi:hypothetical protein
MAAITLQQLAQQALSKLNQLTFNISKVASVPTSTGNVSFKVETTEGKVITFWSSNMDEVVEPTDNEGNYRVIPGTRLAEETLKDGTPALGLIPKGSAKGGIW